MAMTTIEKTVRKAEAETLAADNERRAEAAVLAERLAAATASLTEAQGVPDALLTAVQAGQDVAPAALVEARTAVEIETAKVAGLTARIAATTRGLAPESADGAALLVPLFQRVLLGVPVMATVAPMRSVLTAAKASEGPALVLSQATPTRALGGGLVAVDRVDVTFIRPAWAADLKVLDLEEAARKMDASIRVGSNGREGDYQTFTIRIESAAEAMPLIAKIDDMAVNVAMQNYGAAVMNNLNTYPQPPLIRGGVYQYRSGGVAMNLSKVNFTEDIDADGIRSTRLGFDCRITSADLSGEFMHAAPRAIEPDGFIPGIGRIRAIDVDSVGPNQERVTLTYVSRTR